MPSDLEMFRSVPVQMADVGTPLSYRSFGSGPAVVMVHGWPLNGATFRGLVRELSPRYRCIVVDLPGAGSSPWAAQTTDTFVDFARYVVSFVDALGLSEVALAGHDSGGTIARLVAAELGPRCRALCLNNTEPSHHMPTLVKLYQSFTRLPFAAGLLGLLAGQRWYRRSPLGFAGCFGDIDYADGEFLEACVAPVIRAPEGATRTLACADFAVTHRLPEIHRRITAPVVLSWGEADPFFPIDKARAMLPEFRDLRGLHSIAGRKLLVHEECPRAVAGHFETVLAEC